MSKRKPVPPPPPPPPPPVAPIALSVDQAAEATSLGKSTLYDAMKTGELEFIKVKSRRLILVSALTAWLNRQPKQAA